MGARADDALGRRTGCAHHSLSVIPHTRNLDWPYSPLYTTPCHIPFSFEYQGEDDFLAAKMVFAEVGTVGGLACIRMFAEVGNAWVYWHVLVLRRGTDAVSMGYACVCLACIWAPQRGLCDPPSRPAVGSQACSFMR